MILWSPMRGVLALAVFAAAMGCSATEGPLLVADGTGGTEPEPAAPSERPSDTEPDPTVVPSPVGAGMSFQYQLSGTLDLDLDAELFVVDLFQTSAEAIAELHARERVVVAYLSAGTVESYREDAALFPEEAVGATFTAYPDEAWLDPRHPVVRQLMAERLELARDKGFDGVLPANLHVYRVESGFELSAADQLDYTRWLADAAKRRGLSVGMSGDYRHVEELVDAFDWALHIQCIQNSSCASLAPFQELGRAVFDIEHEGVLETICQEATRLGIVAILKPRALGASREACP